MTPRPAKISLKQWDSRYRQLKRGGLKEPFYGGPLRRHFKDNPCLGRLEMDNSAASLRLWNLLLTEEERLRKARSEGRLVVGAMKDLGTVPVMAYSMPETVAFYPDGAWWIPCLMGRTEVMPKTDELGIDESFCPVRAMLGAFELGSNFPEPDILICSVGAACDDFSAIAQRLESLGHPVFWWEMPRRRRPEAGEKAVVLPGGAFAAPASQVELVKEELERVCGALSKLQRRPLSDVALSRGIKAANKVRKTLASLRSLVFRSEPCPMPALEMLIAEMLIIHFCSDRIEALATLEELLSETERRVKLGQGALPGGAARIFWVNPVADLKAMNILEDCGGRICGTDYMFCHALDPIPEGLPPLEALARSALADPMAGSSKDRAERICKDAVEAGSEALVVSRIPGASHCAWEGGAIIGMAAGRLGLPAIEIEVPSECGGDEGSLRTRLSALVETARRRRR